MRMLISTDYSFSWLKKFHAFGSYVGHLFSFAKNVCYVYASCPICVQYHTFHLASRTSHLSTMFCYFKGLYLEITLREVVFNELLKLGREVLEKTAPGPNREALQKDLNDVESRWTEVFYSTTERQEELEEIVPLAQKYSDSVSDLLPWLTETEQMVADCNAMIVCEKHALIREQTFLKVNG